MNGQLQACHGNELPRALGVWHVARLQWEETEKVRMWDFIFLSLEA